MRRFIFTLYISLFFMVIYFPMIVLIVNSFNSATYSDFWKGFTWKWYFAMMNNDILMQATINSIVLAITSAGVATALSVIISFGFCRYKYIGRKTAYFASQAMMTFPDIVLVTSLLIFFMIFDFTLGFYTLLVGHVILILPFTITIIFMGLKDVDKNLIEASKDLGATDFYTLLKIIFPIIFPSVISSLLVGITLSLDDVVISYFVGGPDFEVLPIVIYSLAKIGATPEINAMCSCIFMLSLVAVILVYFTHKRFKDA